MNRDRQTESTTAPTGVRSARRIARRAAVAVAGVTLLAACTSSSTPDGEGRAWSTRDQSLPPSGQLAVQSGPEQLPVPSGPDVHATALALLEQAAESSNPLLRANAIEALQVEPSVLSPYVTRALTDSNRGVRFVAAMTIAEAKLCTLSHLLEPLLRDGSQSVHAAAIYGLNRCGHRVDPSPLARMMQSDDPEVRANAAVVLGRLGNPTAIPVLRSSLGRGMALVNPIRVRIVELQVAEALVRLGDQSEIDPIRAALFAPVEQSEIVALACQLVGRLQDQNAAAGLIRLVEVGGNEARPPEVRLAALTALSEMGRSVETWRPVVEEYLASTNPGIRTQAALCAGDLGDAALTPQLIGLMSDPEPLVQVAAARSILLLER